MKQERVFMRRLSRCIPVGLLHKTHNWMFAKGAPSVMISQVTMRHLRLRVDMLAPKRGARTYGKYFTAKTLNKTFK